MNTQDGSMRIAFAMSLGNPLGLNWILGVRSLGAKVVVISNREISDNDRIKWCIPRDLTVIYEKDPSIQRGVREAIGGDPNIIFGWWGSRIIPMLRKVKSIFPGSKVVLCVDTLPDARGIAGEVREYLRLAASAALIDGVVHYSNNMKRNFCRALPMYKRKAHLCVIEPFPVSTFARAMSNAKPQLQRLDTLPHVIFTGRGDLLWSTTANMRKDAVGPMLEQLSSYGVHVFVPHDADTRNLPLMHRYPYFSNQSLLEGEFSVYLSDFDAHLVFYNEFNSTIRRRVSNGLSTRFALAITASSPIVVSSSSTFVKEYWSNDAMGFTFESMTDLYEQLLNRPALDTFRQALNENGISHSFDAKRQDIEAFLASLLED